VRTASNNSLGELSTAADVANMDYVLIDLGPYKQYFGKPATNVKIMVHGEPGAGKSYFLLKFANWFAKNRGSALYVAAEEYGSPTLSEKLKSIKTELSPNLVFAQNLDSLNNYHYDLVVIDSVQAAKLTLEQFHELLQRYTNTAFVLVLQKTKEGKYKGAKDWEHDIDIAAEVIFDSEGDRAINVTKNRYQVSGINKI
jgi:predicted ATP-dependent serine protease